jgi:acyl-CoA oxidase
MIEKLHAISSVMKAKTSWFAAQCVRESREMLGGNGFSSYSKLGTLYNDNDVNLTWEGDNHVLIQQTTRYVLEEVQKVLQKGKKTNNDLLKFVDNVHHALFSLLMSSSPSLATH